MSAAFKMFVIIISVIVVLLVLAFSGVLFLRWPTMELLVLSVAPYLLLGTIAHWLLAVMRRRSSSTMFHRPVFAALLTTFFMSPAAIPGGQSPMIYPFWAVVLLGQNQLHWLVVNCLVATVVFSAVLFVKAPPRSMMDTAYASPLMPNTESRITIFSAAWLSFAIVGAVVCFYVQDISAPYWLMGILAFPVVLGLFYAIDRHLSRMEFAKRNSATYMVLMCMSGMLLYWPGLFLILWLMSRFRA